MLASLVSTKSVYRQFCTSRRRAGVEAHADSDQGRRRFAGGAGAIGAGRAQRQDAAKGGVLRADRVDALES